MQEQIAVIGLGYVGLPVAVAFAEVFPGTIGFDINEAKIASLKRGIDPTGEIPPGELNSSALKLTANPDDLDGVTFFIVAVPTPIDRNHRPDLGPIVRASTLIGGHLAPGAVVVYESTVYPGVTEEICGPLLERTSGLARGTDFKLGYSPERINPGDREHTLKRITKIVSGEDAETLERVAAAYGAVIDAGIYRAPSIKVAEAAKVIENTQRDLNIALMNELSLIFGRIGIRTRDVLDAAGTKWNFLPFRPGLVGGHCIGVDPYYLTTKAEELGYHPQVILAGRRINDSMGEHIAHQMVKLLVKSNFSVRGARVGILGLTFKENVPDIRNSRVPDIVNELRTYQIDPIVCDPLGNPREVEEEYGIALAPWDELTDLEGLIVAVNHRQFMEMPQDRLHSCLRPGGVMMDVKSCLDPAKVPDSVVYWSL